MTAQKHRQVRVKVWAIETPRQKRPDAPFPQFASSPEMIRRVVVKYARYPLSLRNLADVPFERGIDICHQTVRLWRNRFGPMFACWR